MLRLGHATESTAVVWVRRTESGVMTVECNGQTFTGDTLAPATDDGTGICTVTGLASNMSYPFVVKVAGVQVDTGTLKTMPAAGDTFTIAATYCFSHTRMPDSIDALLERFDPALSVFMGDNVYLSSGNLSNYSDGVETVTEIGKAGTFETESAAMTAIYKFYRMFFKKPPVNRLFRTCPTYFVSDDHERPGDNWDWTIAQANASCVTGGYANWATTQQQVDDMGLWCRNAMHAYFKGHPSNTHASRDTSWATNKQLYFDTVVGDAHLIFMESIEYSDVGDIMTETFGSAQYTWLKDVLLNSTSTWKIIFCGVPLWNEFGSVDNVFNDWLVSNGIDVVYLAGDLHAAAVFTPSNMLCIRPGPAGATPHTNLTDGYGGSAIYKQLGYFSTVSPTTKHRTASGYLTVNGSDHLDIGFIDDAGNVFWKCVFDSSGYGQHTNLLSS